MAAGLSGGWQWEVFGGRLIRVADGHLLQWGALAPVRNSVTSKQEMGLSIGHAQEHVYETSLVIDGACVALSTVSSART